MDWQNKFGTDTFESFIHKFFLETEINKRFPKAHYMNRRVIIPNIRPNVNAEIVLEDIGVSENYNSFVVTIFHKDNGKIVQQTFLFREYLKLPDNHSDKQQSIPCLVSYCGKDWHCDGPTPESVKNLASRIAEYIELYK